MYLLWGILPPTRWKYLVIQAFALSALIEGLFAPLFPCSTFTCSSKTDLLTRASHCYVIPWTLHHAERHTSLPATTNFIHFQGLQLCHAAVFMNFISQPLPLFVNSQSTKLLSCHEQCVQLADVNIDVHSHTYSTKSFATWSIFTGVWIIWWRFRDTCRWWERQLKPFQWNIRVWHQSLKGKLLQSFLNRTNPFRCYRTHLQKYRSRIYPQNYPYRSNGWIWYLLCCIS